MAQKKKMAQKDQIEIVFASEARIQPEISGWSPPRLAAMEDPMHQALLMACQIGDTSLCCALLSSGHAFDFNRAAIVQDDQRDAASLAKQPAKLALTLLAQSTSALRRSRWSAGDSIDPACAVLLEMISRGASFLALDGQGESPIAHFARTGRQDIFNALAGHPDYDGEKLRAVSCAAVGAPESPMLGHLILRGMLDAAQSLIQDAGMDPNQIDMAGRLAIGYCRSVESFEKLIELGADPELADAAGKNALARAQEITDTQERERASSMLSKLAVAKAKSSGLPEDLDRLRQDNAMSALSAARNAPKSSLLRAISTFKFVPAETRDPKTGSTLLMEALRGGRLASAQWLMERGCKLSDTDFKGKSAASILLAGHGTPNGPSARDLIKSSLSKIDPRARSARGWPLPLEAAAHIGASIAGYGYRSGAEDALAYFIKSRLKAGLALDKEDFHGDDGSTLIEAYWQGLSQSAKASDFRPSTLLALCALQREFGLDPSGYDRGAALVAGAPAQEIDEFNERDGESPDLSTLTSYYSQSFLGSVEEVAAQIGIPMPRLGKAISDKPELCAALARECPATHALAEAGALAALSAPAGKAAPSGRRI